MRTLSIILLSLLFWSCEDTSGPNEVVKASYKFHQILIDEMRDGYRLGDDLFIVKSKNYENIAFIAGKVYTPNNREIVCLWAKTGGTEPFKGMWMSLNSYSKYFPTDKRGWRKNIDKNDCCAIAVKEHAENFRNLP